MRDSPEKPTSNTRIVPNASQVTARNQQARRSSKPLLDPHGIYGTRTAYRVRAAQRRQAIQYLCAFAVVLLLAFSLVSWLRAPRIAKVSSAWLKSLMAFPTASPASVNTSDGAWLLVPTESGQLITVKAASGEFGAVFTTTFPLRAEPVVSGEHAFVPGEDGTLFAVNWKSGQALWSYRTRGSMSARPALVRVQLPLSNSVGASAGAATAKFVSVLASAPASQLRPIVIVGNDGGEIIALEAGRGTPVWRRKAPAAIGGGLVAVPSTPKGSGNSSPLVLVPLMGGLGTRGGLLCLDAQSGRILWRADLRAAHLAPPAVETPTAAGGRGRVFTVGDDGAVFCLDLQSGRRDRGGWKTFMRPLSGAPADSGVVLRAEPLLKTYSWGTRLFVGGNDGGVRCLDADNGRVLWTFDAGAPVRCRLRSLRLQSVDNQRDLLLIGNDSTTIHAVDARSGELAGQFGANGNASFAPVVTDDQLLNVATNGEVESFSLRNGLGAT